jgi:hypothetical protein
MVMGYFVNIGDMGLSLVLLHHVIQVVGHTTVLQPNLDEV